MNPYNVIKGPVLSEKSNDCRENERAYTFRVRLDASKYDVKKAVEKLFEVNVRSVNTSIKRGKLKRRGYQVSLLPKEKKAIVRLVEGQKLDIFEDQ